MSSETYFFYNEDSDNNKRLKALIKSLDDAIELEKQNNPEVFKQSNEFHFTTIPNKIMDQLAKDFAESVTDFPQWVYAVFLVGEVAYNDFDIYSRKGRAEYLEEIRSEHYSICYDNKVIANILFSKRPWIVYERIRYVLDKVGFICK